jgi:flagellar assembly factor FliW
MGESNVSVGDEATIRFEEGIIGLPHAKRFQLLAKHGSAVRVLSCLDVEGLALPVTDPLLADRNYRPELGARIQEALELAEGDPVLFLAVTTRELDGLVANLRAPLVVNVRCRRAVQVILDDRSYPLRAPVKVDA